MHGKEVPEQRRWFDHNDNPIAALHRRRDIEQRASAIFVRLQKLGEHAERIGVRCLDQLHHCGLDIVSPQTKLCVSHWKWSPFIGSCRWSGGSESCEIQSGFRQGYVQALLFRLAKAR